MSEPFVGEIKLLGFGFAPRNWAACDGAVIPISQNNALYSLIGDTFGGDGRTNFKLPDMRGRTPVSPGNGLLQGQGGGIEQVTLQSQELGAHTHTMLASPEPGTRSGPGNSSDRVFAVTSDQSAMYGQASNLTQLNQQSTEAAGGGTAHSNIQPTQVVNFAIALLGVYPSRD